MRCTVVVEFDGQPGESPRRVKLLRLHRDDTNPSPGDIGLTLAEAKTAMSAFQQEFVVEQIGGFYRRRRKCERCNTTCRLHDGRCSRVAHRAWACVLCARAVEGLRVLRRWHPILVAPEGVCF